VFYNKPDAGCLYRVQRGLCLQAVMKPQLNQGRISRQMGAGRDGRRAEGDGKRKYE